MEALLPVDERWIFLHGFTQTHRSWNPLLAALARRWRADSISAPSISLIDMPGHGLSRPPDEPGLGHDADTIMALAGAGTYVGYSMGGRFALTAAVRDHTSSRRIQRLVLISASPGLADADQRADRIAADQARASRIVEIGVSAFLDEWLAQPLFAGLDATDIDDRCANTAEGLATSLLHSGSGSQQPVWGNLGQITIPVLLIVGARDEKFVEIGHHMMERLPDATMATIPSAGHAVHNEAPDAVAAEIVNWAESATMADAIVS